MEAQIKYLVLISFLLLPVAHAARTALIAVEGAMVYQKGDFDSAVIGYLPRGKKVLVSSKNFGPFHRIRFREGVTGYISDVDIVTEAGAPFSSINSGEAEEEAPKEPGDATAPQKKKKPKTPAKRVNRHVPVANAVALGPVVGLIAYKELVSRREYSEQMTAFGLRFSTRAPFLQGPYGLELTFLMNSTPPKYYSTFATAASGTYYFFDAVWTFPFFEVMGKDAMFMMGIGPLVTYSNVTARVNGVDFKQSDTVIGASVQGGLAFRISTFILKTDAKYYLDKNSYLGFLGSLQYEF